MIFRASSRNSTDYTYVYCRLNLYVADTNYNLKELKAPRVIKDKCFADHMMHTTAPGLSKIIHALLHGN
jgi:hypothetical protein